MKDLKKKDLTRKGEVGLSRGLLVSGNDERGG